MRNFTLEQRISKIESLLNKKYRHMKNEDVDQDMVSPEDLHSAVVEAIEEVGTDYQAIADYISEYGWEEGVDYTREMLSQEILNSGGDPVAGGDFEDAVLFWFNSNMTPFEFDSESSWVNAVTALSQGAMRKQIKDCAINAGTDDLSAVKAALMTLSGKLLNKYRSWKQDSWEEFSRDCCDDLDFDNFEDDFGRQR